MSINDSSDKLKDAQITALVIPLPRCLRRYSFLRDRFDANLRRAIVVHYIILG